VIVARKVQVEIVGDTRNLERAFGRASKEGGKLERGLKAVGKASAIAIGAGVGAGLVGVAFAARASIKEFADAQKVTAQTNAVLKSTGGIANVTAKHVNALGSAILKKSGIDDEAIKSGENMLLTFKNIRNEAGKSNKIFDQATRAVTDMDVAMTHGASTQESLSRTAIRVGKALNDPIKGITALGRVGVQFTESQKKQIKALVDGGHAMEAQKIILKELTSEFGGSAAAAGGTLAGKLNILRETLKNLGAEMVTKLLPTLNRFSSWAIGVGLPAVEKFARGIDFKAVFNELRAPVESAISVVRGFVGALGDIRAKLGPDIFSGLVIGIVGAAGALQAIAKLRAAMLAMAALGVGSGPVALAFLGLTVIIGGLAAAFLHNRRASDDLSDAYDHVKNAANSLHDAEVNLKQANLDVTQAQLEQKHALDNVASSQKAYNEAVRQYGAHSQEAIAALHNLQQAKHDQKQADLDLVTATDRAKKANREAAQTARDTTGDILDAAAKQRGAGHSMVMNAITFGRSWHNASENADEFAQSIRKAAKANEKAQPLIAAAQRAVAALADSLGRIPSDTTIRFIVKTMMFTPGNSPRGGAFQGGGHAAGGRIGGARTNADSVPAMLSPGEFVVTGGGERMLETMTFPGVLNWLQGAQPRHFAGGGRAGFDTRTIEYDRLYRGPSGGGAVSTHGLVPQVTRALSYARGHGWGGSVISGFRTYAEQAALYANYLAGGNIAARPGTSSHESGQAVDVSDASTFDVLMGRAPGGSQLFNLVPGDFNHFSVSGYAAGGRVGKKKPKHIPPRLPQPIRLAEARAAGTYGLSDDISAYGSELGWINKELGRKDLTSSERSSLKVRKVRVQNRLSSLHTRQNKRQRVKETDYSQLPSSIVLQISQARLAFAKARTPQQRIDARATLRAKLTRAKVWLEGQLKKKLNQTQRSAVIDALTGIIDELNGLSDADDVAELAGETPDVSPDLQAQLDQANARAAASEESARLANAFVATGVFASNTPGGSGSPTFNFGFLIPDADALLKATAAIANGAGMQPYVGTSVEKTGY
jgi:hypothetical protein